MSDDIHHLLDTSDGLAIGEQVARGDVAPRDLLDAVITRIEAVDPAINAVVDHLYDDARASLEHPFTAKMPFAGVPTLIKDLFSPVKGALMTNGSISAGDMRVPFDDEVVSRLRRAGVVLVGTTTAPEFGTSYTTESTRLGATRNPWNTDHSAGGSSGGAAALVAARVVPFAHGNDGGGSLRVPASCCGVFGFKPSRGVMPSGPMTGEGWAGMSTSHVITRSVRDSAALLDASAGMDTGAPYAAPRPDTTYLASAGRRPEALRIGVIEGRELSPEAKDVEEQTIALCEALGHRAERVTLPLNWDEFYDRCFDIIGPNTRQYLDMVGEQRGRAVAMDELEPRTRVILRERGSISAPRYISAVSYIHALGRAMATAMTDIDVILSPTLSRQPPKIGTLDAFDERLSLDDIIHAFHSYSPFTALANATGQPAMSVPLFWTPDGLPLGSHFGGRFGEETRLFSLAAQLEEARPWAGRVPPINACQ
ncbi:amidase [Larsenimonas rhizosphaerae]|uniref:Amidase family protein n=1 Tax=Larsenimonas rhizosphaerae TaxID=2944682 RepID=A0AA41ZJC5_9GAMM|nr:amidase family protein [Larsenimonas rhizosphaerae]MCX2525314.1 amidase family protein [Larsenimonas rhizosphaerae]